MVNLTTRRATPDDVPFLWDMLYEAAYPLPDLRPPPPFDEFRSDGFHDRYITGWGRDGDLGLIAEAADGRQLGAAWFRLFTNQFHAHAFLGEDVPELSIAVGREHRGQGVGAAQLARLIVEASEHGFHAISLSAAAPNPAQRLYERMGFVRLSLDEGSWTMRLDLRA